MLYNVSDIITDVKIRLDENDVTPALLTGDVNQLTFEELIKSVIVDAATNVNLIASNEKLDGETLATTATINQDGSGYIVLPSDFMRLIVFRMSSWKKPITQPITDTDPLYNLQHNKYVRGGITSPVCVLTTSQAGKILEFYSVDPTATNSISKALYVPYPKIINETITISQKIYVAVIYWICGIVASILGDKNKSDNYFALAQSYL